MTNTESIIKSRNRDLFQHHQLRLKSYLKNRAKLKLKVQNAIIKYYHTQVNESNIINYYNTRIEIFVTELLT